MQIVENIPGVDILGKHQAELNGFIGKRRVGRRNTYTVNEGAILSFPVYRDVNVAQIAKALHVIMDENRAGVTA